VHAVIKCAAGMDICTAGRPLRFLVTCEILRRFPQCTVACKANRGVTSSPKLKFHGNSFLVASVSHPRDIFARMSLTCQEKIERLGRVGKGCYEDTRYLSATSLACRARGLRRTTRHTDKRSDLYTAADRQPINQISAWPAERESRPTRPTGGTFS